MQFALCVRTRLCVWIPVRQLLRSSLPFSTIYRVHAVALYRPDLSAFIQPPSSLNIVPRVNSFQFPVVAAFDRYLPSILNLHEDRKITKLGGYIVPTPPSVDDFPLFGENCIVTSIQCS